ncbi:MAG: DUF2277 domain-containing protein [Verrucomicrobia bacterium]|nr:MAG: DUF2277 domain-containing protein [Verrucomicrobiota bacterium]
MCRNIKTLHNFKPAATDEEIRASSLQFVRKLSGFTRPSKVNEYAFTRAVDGVTQVARELLNSLVTNTPPRDREVEALKALARSAKKFSSLSAPAIPVHNDS